MEIEKGLNILFKNNGLIKAKYDFTLIQNRIVQQAFAYIQKNRSMEAFFTLDEMKEITGNNNTRCINSIKEILDELMKNKVIQTKENGSWMSSHIIAAHGFDKTTNTFTISLSSIFIKMILSYKENGFTTMNVTRYLELGGTNAQRLYELLRMWTGSKVKIEYSPKEIREYLCLVGKYNVFSDFRKRVIEASVKEINKRGLMNIYKVEYIKKGRVVDKIIFYVEDLEPRNYNFNENKPFSDTPVPNKIDSDGNTPLSGQMDIDDYKVEEHEDISEIDKLSEKVKLSVNTLEKLGKEYGMDELIVACDILLESKGVTARLKYLKGILEKRKNNPPKERKSKKKSNWKSGNETYSDINNSDDDKVNKDDVDTQEFLKSLGLVD